MVDAHAELRNAHCDSEAQGPPPHTPGMHLCCNGILRRGHTYLFHSWSKCMVPKAEDKNFPKERNIKQGPPSPKGKQQKLTSFGPPAVVALESMTLTEDSDMQPLAHPTAEPCTSPLLWGAYEASFGPHNHVHTLLSPEGNANATFSSYFLHMNLWLQHSPD